MSHASVTKHFLHDSEVKDFLNNLLIGKIFHVTSARGLKGIYKSRIIYSNYNRIFPLAHVGQIGYGLRNDFVSFFDLRNIDSDNMPYDYLYYPRPNNWTKYSFLIFNPKYYDELKFQNSEFTNFCDIFPEGTKIPTAEEPANYIPKYECWYPGKCSLDRISEIVNIQINWTEQEKLKRSYFRPFLFQNK